MLFTAIVNMMSFLALFQGVSCRCREFSQRALSDLLRIASGKEQPQGLAGSVAATARLPSDLTAFVQVSAPAITAGLQRTVECISDVGAMTSQPAVEEFWKCMDGMSVVLVSPFLGSFVTF